MSRPCRRIVCVEDDFEVVDLVRLIVAQRGYELIGAMGGEEGLQIIREIRPDLVLLDLMMPDMDGWEVYRRLRVDEATRDIPVVVVTAKVQSIDRVLALHIAKVDAYVTKPFTPQELLDSIDRVLSGSS